MTTFSPSDHPAIAAVVALVGPLVDHDVSTRKGKDSGWFAQDEADSTTTVERRFTEKRGMAYVPVTYAFRLTSEGTINPTNRTAERILSDTLDD